MTATSLYRLALPAAADAVRRERLAGIAHDLRSPLTRLRLRAGIECAPATARALEADCDLLDRIIGQFLAYAQGAAGVSLGEPEPLAALVRHLAAGYAERGLRVARLDACASRVLLPDLAVWRILGNLVDNAFAHGRAPVELSVVVDAAECRLVVSDAGPGIAPADAHELERPFVTRRGRASAGHVGLGLAIVAQLCDALGGTLCHGAFDGSRSLVGVVLPLTGRAGALELMRATPRAASP